MKTCFINVLVWTALLSVSGGCQSAGSGDGQPKDVVILQSWNGDYPVAQLQRLPEGQDRSPVGYLGAAAAFAAVWQAFKPGEDVPRIDFDRNLILFARNVDFYNRMSIVKVSVKNSVADVMTIETRSAMPISDKVAVALAVIPRAGVRFIRVGNERIPVLSNSALIADGGMRPDKNCQ